MYIHTPTVGNGQWTGICGSQVGYQHHYTQVMNNNYDRFSSCKTSPLIFYLRSSFCKVTIYHFLLSFSYTFHCWYLWFAKPWVSGCESMGFRVWNHGFQEVKPRLSDCNLMGFFVVSLWLFGRFSTGVYSVYKIFFFWLFLDNYFVLLW